MRMLWFALLYGVVTASAAAEMDNINAGIRARIAALQTQPPQELRLSMSRSSVKEEANADEASASSARKQDPRCITWTVSAESCSMPNVRCSPPPTIDAKTTVGSLPAELGDDQRVTRTGDNHGLQAL